MPPFLFSIIIIVLIISIVQIAKLKYSRTVKLTQLSSYPYYVILTYLLVEAIEIVIVMIAYKEILEAGSFIAPLYTSILPPLYGTFSVGKFMMFVVFVSCQIFEWHIYWFFMLF